MNERMDQLLRKFNDPKRQLDGIEWSELVILLVARNDELLETIEDIRRTHIDDEPQYIDKNSKAEDY